MNRRSANTTKVFVGSLPSGTTVEELRNLFAPYGEIAECDVVNRCGFLHLENRQLAFKAIDELNNYSFKGSRISVEKGRVKPPPGRSGREGGGSSSSSFRGGGSRGGRGQRNGFGSGGGGGPMRGSRDNYRSAPYPRSGSGSGSDYERRPPRVGVSSGGPMRRDNGYGGGFDRGYDNRPPPTSLLHSSRGLNEGYGGGGGGVGPDRRSYLDDRRSGYGDDRRYPDSGYVNMGPGGDSRMYSEDRGMYSEDRQPSIDSRPSYDRFNSGMMSDRRPPEPERRPLMDSILPVMGGSGGGGYSSMASMQSSYDRRPQTDMYSRREMPSKSMGGGGDYNESGRDGSGYDSAYPPLPQRGYAGGPGPRRDMPPARRY